MKQIRKTIVLQTSTKRFPLALTQQQDTLLTLFSPTILEAGLHCDTVCLDQQRGISGLVAHRLVLQLAWWLRTPGGLLGKQNTCVHPGIDARR